VPQFSLCLLSVFLSLLSTSTKNIEKAFLQNNPGQLFSLLSEKSYIHISLPEPISFSDQLSSQQAYFFFRKTFRTFKTFEFYSENNSIRFPEKGVTIFKARWSFINKKNNNQYVFQIYFYLRSNQDRGKTISASGASRESSKIFNIWKITEIKAEKL
jgi:hypothetical protein